jgi:hypothetical protein
MSTLKNKREPWNFEDFGQVEISSIQDEVMSYYNEWLVDTTRQDTFQTHKDTFAIQLTALDYLHGIGQAGDCTTSKKLKNEFAKAEFDKLVNKVEQLAAGKLIRAEFISMKLKSRIRAHKDRSDLLYLSRRFHVPIKTNPYVTFSAGADVRHLHFGRLYELNNINYHGVRNDSDENRIHLILDVLPEQYLEGIRFIDETE